MRLRFLELLYARLTSSSSEPRSIYIHLTGLMQDPVEAAITNVATIVESTLRATSFSATPAE